MNSHIATFIKKLPQNSFFVLHGNTEVLRNGDVFFPFRQSSYFLYLTGLNIPSIILTIFWDEIIIWRDPISEKEKIWWHSKWNDTKISEISGITDIRDIIGFQEYKNKNEHHFIEEAIYLPIIHRLRLLKTPDEIQKIQKVIKITNYIFSYIQEYAKPGMYEYEIDAMVAYQFRIHQGIEAFPSIVASGPNGCILHYTHNNRQINQGDLVLLDFGIEIDGYGADISRTFSISWEFDSRQQCLYNAVLDVKWFAESILKPWISRKNWNSQVKEYMWETCRKLDLPNIEKYTPLENPYFPHSIGHFLWLDTHDVGDVDTIFQSGMVVTIEPGIYIVEEGIGIRIEDDYLITESGCSMFS